MMIMRSLILVMVYKFYVVISWKINIDFFYFLMALSKSYL